MDPLSAWTLVAFITVLSAGLLLLEVGMRRARGATGKRSSRGPAASTRSQQPLNDLASWPGSEAM